MKSGIAAGIAVLEDFAASSDRLGNLILFATPDEERSSRGMRNLRDAFPAIAAEFEVDIEAGINLDATSDQGDGSEGRAIYRGTIGKALPFALVIGHSSHASYPFEGVSAQLMAAEITKAVEANPVLCDKAAGEISPPPSNSASWRRPRVGSQIASRHAGNVGGRQVMVTGSPVSVGRELRRSPPRQRLGVPYRARRCDHRQERQRSTSAIERIEKT